MGDLSDAGIPLLSSPGQMVVGQRERRMGFHSGDEGFEGEVDQLLVWSKRRSQTQIAVDMFIGDFSRLRSTIGFDAVYTGDQANDLVGAWDFDECDPRAVRDSSPQGEESVLLSPGAMVEPGYPE